MPESKLSTVDQIGAIQDDLGQDVRDALTVVDIARGTYYELSEMLTVLDLISHKLDSIKAAHGRIAELAPYVRSQG